MGDLFRMTAELSHASLPREANRGEEQMQSPTQRTLKNLTQLGDEGPRNNSQSTSSRPAKLGYDRPLDFRPAKLDDHPREIDAIKLLAHVVKPSDRE
jgi:hypothetical protein